MKFITLIILCACSVYVTFAQATSKSFTLDECMEYAVSNNNNVSTAIIDQHNAQADIKQTFGARLPTLNSSLSSTANFGRGIDPASNSYINTSTLNNNFGVELNIPIYTGGQLFNNSRIAKIAKLRSDDVLTATKDDIAEQTMIAYIEALYNSQLYVLYQQMVHNYTEQEQRMVRMCELGNGSDTDLAQIRAALYKEKLRSTKAKQTYDGSILNLKIIMNFPINDSLRISDEVIVTELYNPTESIGELFESATKINPTIKAAQRDVEISKLTLKSNKSVYIPTLYASGGISTSYFTRLDDIQMGTVDPFGKQLNNNLGGWGGLSVSIPIFNGLKYKYDIIKAENSLKQTELALNEELNQFSKELEQALVDLKSLEQQWSEALDNVKFNKLANDAFKRKYSEGAINILELQSSDNQLLEAEVELRYTYLCYQIKLREVNYYKGIPYIK